MSTKIKIDFRQICGAHRARRGLELCAVAGLTPVLFGFKPGADRLIEAFKTISNQPAVFIDVTDAELDSREYWRPNMTQGDVPFFIHGTDELASEHHRHESSFAILKRVEAAQKIFGQVEDKVDFGSESALAMDAGQEKLAERGQPFRTWNVMRLARASAALDGVTVLRPKHILEAIRFQ